MRRTSDAEITRPLNELPSEPPPLPSWHVHLELQIPKDVEMHYQFQEGLPMIDADAAQLRQVAMNLITNAAEAMTDRPGRVVIASWTSPCPR